MIPAPDAPARPALRYHGAKWRLAPWIISHFPDHECYVEPFGGSAAVLLQKPRSYLEVYNDLDGEVVSFFKTLRDRPDDLVRAIELTPWAKTEWELSFESSDDPVEAGRRFYVRAFMSIAGPTAQWNPGWRRQKTYSRGRDGKRCMTPGPITFMRIDHLHQVAQRFRGVQIEQDTAIAVVERFDTLETLFYIDPPYVASTRGRWKDKAYRHEMADDDHRDLARALQAIQGMAMISGYACQLYVELYEQQGWERIDKLARVNGKGSAMESLWLSPELQARREAQPSTLFEFANVEIE